jgi:AcrR family transcriptional regulator
MGRLSTFEDRDVFAAVGARLARAGKATFQEIVADTGVSVGSLYHRFVSREGLLAETFLDALTAFQSRFIEALSGGDLEAGANAALSVPAFCREERAKAVVLACCRASEFVTDETPTAFRVEIERANRRAAAALRRFAADNALDLDAARLALAGFPLGAVRLYLPSRSVPTTIDAAIAAAYWSAVGG